MSFFEGGSPDGDHATSTFEHPGHGLLFHVHCNSRSGQRCTSKAAAALPRYCCPRNSTPNIFDSEPHDHLLGCSLLGVCPGSDCAQRPKVNDFVRSASLSPGGWKNFGQRSCALMMRQQNASDRTRDPNWNGLCEGLLHEMNGGSIMSAFEIHVEKRMDQLSQQESLQRNGT